MKTPQFIKKFLCKHNYIPLANVHGDMINAINCRTLIICNKCRKIKFIKEYIEAPLSYNAMCEFTYFKNIAGEEVAWDRVKDHIFKNKQQFIELFGDKNGDS